MHHNISAEVLKEYLSKVILEDDVDYIEEKNSIINSFRHVRMRKEHKVDNTSKIT